MQFKNFPEYAAETAESSNYSLLPSSIKYLLSREGKISDFKESKEIVPRLVNERLVVEIDWIEGFKDYDLALLIAHCFKKTQLPIHYWTKVTVLFKDKNSSNLNPDNLIWKFPIGLGSDKYNGFAFVPGFTRYMINRDGELYDLKNLKFIEPYSSINYKAFAVRNDANVRTGLKRHRAVGLAFLDYDERVDDMEINHKNGKPGQDHLDNLEWMTHKENMEHAAKNGLLSNNKPVMVTDTTTGKVEEFVSVLEFARKYKYANARIARNLQKNGGTCQFGDLSVTYKYAKHKEGGVMQPIMVRDAMAGTVRTYESARACAEALGLSVAVVRARLASTTNRLSFDYLQFKRVSDKSPWHIPEDLNQEVINNRWYTSTLVKDLNTGEVHTFVTQRKAAEYLGLSDVTICTLLRKRNQPVIKNVLNGHYVLLTTRQDFESWREVTDPHREYQLHSGRRPVLVKDARTDEVKEYENCVDCANDLGILTTTLHWRLKSRGQKLYEDGFMYKYKFDEMEFMTISESLRSILLSAPTLKKE